MGLKRKASALEESSFYQPSSPPSLVSTSTQSSPSSMCTEPYHQPQLTFHWTTNSEPAPWLNVRTRKRVRDNRPPEDAVYSNTIRMLFDAQKSGDDNVPTPTLPEKELDLNVDMDMGIDTEVNGEHTLLSVSLDPEPNQRSLHEFFPSNVSNPQPLKQQTMPSFSSNSDPQPSQPQEQHTSSIHIDNKT